MLKLSFFSRSVSASKNTRTIIPPEICHRLSRTWTSLESGGWSVLASGIRLPLSGHIGAEYSSSYHTSSLKRKAFKSPEFITTFPFSGVRLLKCTLTSIRIFPSVDPGGQLHQSPYLHIYWTRSILRNRKKK